MKPLKGSSNKKCVHPASIGWGVFHRYFRVGCEIGAINGLWIIPFSTLRLVWSFTFTFILNRNRKHGGTMSFRDDNADDALRKPLLHTGSWYRMSSRQSSMMGSSAQILRESISIYLCVLIVALGPIQFGFTVCPLISPSPCICLCKILSLFSH